VSECCSHLQSEATLHSPTHSLTLTHTTTLLYYTIISVSHLLTDPTLTHTLTHTHSDSIMPICHSHTHSQFATLLTKYSQVEHDPSSHFTLPHCHWATHSLTRYPCPPSTTPQASPYYSLTRSLNNPSINFLGTHSISISTSLLYCLTPSHSLHCFT
jgi:hypothetical protein